MVSGPQPTCGGAPAAEDAARCSVIPWSPLPWSTATEHGRRPTVGPRPQPLPLLVLLGRPLWVVLRGERHALH